MQMRRRFATSSVPRRELVTYVLHIGMSGTSLLYGILHSNLVIESTPDQKSLFHHLLQELHNLTGKLLDQRVAEVGNALAQNKEVSTIKKHAMLQDIDVLKQAQLKLAKEKQKKLIAAAKEEADSLELEKISVNGFIVHVIEADLDGDAKAVNGFADALKKKFPKQPYLVMTRIGLDGLLVKAECPGKEKNAKEWTMSCLPESAKGGGNDKAAQGSAQEGVSDDAFTKALEQAKAFVN